MGTRDFRNAGTTKTLGQNASTPQDQGKDWFTRQYFFFRNGEVAALPVFTSQAGYAVSFGRRGDTRGSLGVCRCLSVVCVSMRKERKDEGITRMNVSVMMRRERSEIAMGVIKNRNNPRPCAAEENGKHEFHVPV